MDLQDSVQRSLQNPADKSCRSAQIREDRKPGFCVQVKEREKITSREQCPIQQYANLYKVGTIPNDQKAQFVLFAQSTSPSN